MPSSPTARSLAYCRRQGWPAGVVERWIGPARVRKDLFGWCDLVVVERIGHDCELAHGEDSYGPDCNPSHPIKRILGVQACAGASHAARRAKAAPLVGPWIEAGGAAEVWSWSKTGPRGKVKRWTLRREVIPPASTGAPSRHDPAFLRPNTRPDRLALLRAASDD